MPTTPTDPTEPANNNCQTNKMTQEDNYNRPSPSTCAALETVETTLTQALTVDWQWGSGQRESSPVRPTVGLELKTVPQVSTRSQHNHARSDLSKKSPKGLNKFMAEIGSLLECAPAEPAETSIEPFNDSDINLLTTHIDYETIVIEDDDMFEDPESSAAKDDFLDEPDIDQVLLACSEQVETTILKEKTAGTALHNSNRPATESTVNRSFFENDAFINDIFKSRDIDNFLKERHTSVPERKDTDSLR